MDYVVRKGNGDIKLMLLWVGLTLYNIGTLAENFFDLYNVFIYKLLIYSGLLVSAYSIFSNITFDFKNRNLYFKVVASVLFLWYLFMLANSDLQYFLSLQNFIIPYSMISYSVFFVLFFNTENMVRTFVKFGYKINYLFLFSFIVPAFASVSTNFVQLMLESFAVCAGFIFITNKYHSNKNILISLIVLLIAFLVATLQARRNLMLTFGFYIAVGGFVALVNGKLKTLESRILVFFLGLLTMVGALTFYMSESTGTFSKITGRASENTREEVFMAFAVDMSNMKDILIGRGFSGQYYSPGVDKDDYGEYNDYRSVVECAYLQLILKGGVVYLVIYLALILGAVYRGFKGKNQFVRGMSYILIIQLIDMVPFGLHAFNIKAFMIWLAISVCYDCKFCNLSDDEVANLLFKSVRKYLPWEK